jgi:NADH-quinone oxidoreductase subunit J
MPNPHYMPILILLLGAVGAWLMLPRGPSRGRGVGMILAAAALALGASRLPCLGRWTAEGLFLILAGVTVVSALGAVTFHNPVYCAIWFGQSLLGTAGLFLVAGAQFLAVATVVVYAGAILVTFLFVLMLAQPKGKAAYDRVSWEAPLAAAAGVVMVGVLSVVIGGVFSRPLVPPADAALVAGVLTPQHVAQFGGQLFDRYLIAIEVAGTLLLAALVGAAVIVQQKESDN